MLEVSDTYYKRDFWAEENLKYAQPHFRMSKAARIVNQIAKGKACDLLDVGCGPATLMQLLDDNVRYFGIDIAIQKPAPFLIQADFVEAPLRFESRQFDLIVAQGVFEYMGKKQEKKFEEIRELLKPGGTVLVSYVNFDHRNKLLYWPYNNIQSFDDFYGSLTRFFHVLRYLPTSQKWAHDEPKGRVAKAIQMHLNFNLPLITRMFAVEYFYICRCLESS